MAGSSHYTHTLRRWDKTFNYQPVLFHYWCTGGTRRFLICHHSAQKLNQGPFKCKASMLIPALYIEQWCISLWPDHKMNSPSLVTVSSSCPIRVRLVSQSLGIVTASQTTHSMPLSRRRTVTATSREKTLPCLCLNICLPWHKAWQCSTDWVIGAMIITIHLNYLVTKIQCFKVILKNNVILCKTLKYVHANHYGNCTNHFSITIFPYLYIEVTMKFVILWP